MLSLKFGLHLLSVDLFKNSATHWTQYPWAYLLITGLSNIDFVIIWKVTVWAFVRGIIISIRLDSLLFLRLLGWIHFYSIIGPFISIFLISYLRWLKEEALFTTLIFFHSVVICQLRGFFRTFGSTLSLFRQVNYRLELFNFIITAGHFSIL